jgi:hypothetical protein
MPALKIPINNAAISTMGHNPYAQPATDTLSLVKASSVSGLFRRVLKMVSSPGSGFRRGLGVTSFLSLQIAAGAAKPARQPKRISRVTAWNDIRHFKANVAPRHRIWRTNMGEVIRFVSKAELERARLIREARARYDSIFPPADPESQQRDVKNELAES